MKKKYITPPIVKNWTLIESQGILCESDEKKSDEQVENLTRGSHTVTWY